MQFRFGLPPCGRIIAPATVASSNSAGICRHRHSPRGPLPPYPEKGAISPVFGAAPGNATLPSGPLALSDGFESWDDALYENGDEENLDG